MKTIHELCLEHCSDKAPEIQHSYAPIYDDLFKDLKVKKILEIGVGYPGLMNRHIDFASKGYIYKTGASLFVWRDYFVDAMVYGIDSHPEAQVVGEDRIQTFLCDSLDDETVHRIMDEIGPFDIIIDDGCHMSGYQLKTAQLFLPYVKKGGLYFIEDVGDTQFLLRNLRNEKPERLTKKQGDKLLLIRC